MVPPVHRISPLAFFCYTSGPASKFVRRGAMSFYAVLQGIVRPLRSHPDAARQRGRGPAVHAVRKSSSSTRFASIGMTALLLLITPAVTSAHDIPKSVTVLAFV